jgi:hydrogenase nickel incorporation protein HypA/HybF
MHELSVASAILDTALAHAEGRPVAAVAVTIGGLRQVVPDSLRFYFEIVARDTACERAALQLTVNEPVLGCECGHEWELSTPAFRCPECGSADVRVLAGDELIVEYIEVEQEDVACIAPR